MSYMGEQTIKGKIYVYEATAVWDAEKQHSKQKRVYIGTKDPKTGELIPNKKYYELYGGQPEPKGSEILHSVMKSVDYGNVYLFREIARVIGVAKILQSVFPDCWQEILACAWYSVIEPGALYLCEIWSESAAIAEGLNLASQRLSELLKHIDDNSRMTFFKKWAALRMQTEYLALDITSISSYSELIEYVEYGYNRDEEKLPQINLAMLFGETSRLPVFCRVYPGSIKDVSALSGMANLIDNLKVDRMHFVMDKGFYSEKGLEPLLTKRTKFAVGVPFTASLAKDLTRKSMADITNPSNALQVNGQLFYARTWKVKMCERRVYVHVYFDEERHTTERSAFMNKLLKMESAIADGNLSEDDAQVKKYFTLHHSKNGLHIHRNEDTIRKETELNGYFVILTNDSRDPKYILDIYRTKDAVEKSFDNLKNDLYLKRLNIHSDAAMEGRIFIGFIALIFTSYIRSVMKQQNLYKKYTFTSMLLELKKLKLIYLSNRKVMMTELTGRQKELYKAFGFDTPDPASI